MNKRKKFRSLGWLVCALTLAFIVGCQSVGGLNLNEMLLKQFDVAQQEQSELLEFEIELNEGALDGEDPELAKFVEMFSKVQLELAHVKTDAAGKQWATGSFGFGKGKIPFTLHTDGYSFRFDIEGAKRPFVIADQSFGELFGLGAEEGEALQRSLMEAVRELVKNVAAYFVKGLPNPPTISVERVSEPVRGVTTSLTKVHAELNGEQLGDLIPVYLDNLIQDREGFKELVVGVYRWLLELPPEIQEMMGTQELFGEVEDIEAVADMIVLALFPELETAAEELDEFRQSDGWKEVFDKGITISTDWYVDDKLHLRKSATEITIAPVAFASEDSPVKSIKLRASGEAWNVNGEVEVPELVIPRNALNVEELEGLTAYQFVRYFEEDSVLYDLLKNDLGIDDQRFELSSEWGIPFIVDESGDAFVPVRRTLEDFEIGLTVPQSPGEIRFYDRPTDQSIVLRIGSDQATVNGETVQLKHPIAVEYRVSYVAADDLFGLLGAEYTIIELEDGELVMEVSRDL
ncbi:stalk domain-containing protein [Paenibacillaceae bacterium WGS1546]|uniref:stalk domain-containing protein n=1 Tax=Cohnella sp. WGS1546 TaxID=3366810 RepID=UPI00372CE96E